MSPQIQTDLFGISSYKNTRTPVKGQKASAMQMTLFPLVDMIKATTLILKKGQRYMVKKTAMVVTFIRRSGKTTVWAHDGHMYRVSDAILVNAGIQALKANTE